MHPERSAGAYDCDVRSCRAAVSFASTNVCEIVVRTLEGPAFGQHHNALLKNDEFVRGDIESGTDFWALAITAGTCEVVGGVFAADRSYNPR